MRVIHRVKILIDNKNISISAFEKSIEMSNNSIQTAIKREASVKDDVINKILNVYSDVSPIWLLTGKGEMLLKDQEQGLGNVAEAPTMYQQEPTASLNQFSTREIVTYIVDNDVDFLEDAVFRTYIKATYYEAKYEEVVKKLGEK